MWKAQIHSLPNSVIPFLRMADTATASVEAIIAENRAACCQVQPRLLRPRTYSRMGTNMAVLAMTTRKAKEMTCMSICMRNIVLGMSKIDKLESRVQVAKPYMLRSGKQQDDAVA